MLFGEIISFWGSLDWDEKVFRKKILGKENGFGLVSGKEIVGCSMWLGFVIRWIWIRVYVWVFFFVKEDFR